MAELLSRLLSALHAFAWGPVMMALLLGTGLYFTLGTGCFQIRHGGLWLKNAAGLLRAKPAGDKGLTPFEALSTALAGTLGTGNIVGVATALTAGGPGAIFWMWVSGLIGMMTKYAEVVLALRFRRKDAGGHYFGGPMFYMLDGLGPRAKPLALAFSLCGALAAFGIGNMAQSNAIAGAAEGALQSLNILPPGGGPLLRQAVGVLVAVLTGLTLLGGVGRIGKVAAYLVPAAAVLYIAMAGAVLVTHGDRILPAFALIVGDAFGARAVGGGVAGYAMSRVSVGLARGVFTNEAGLGSAPIAHACADAEPVEQGLLGIFEVFVDTLVLCTLTALAILCSGAWGGGGDGAALTGRAFAGTLGPAAPALLAAAVAIFAFATLLSWSLYGQRCFAFLLGGRGESLYRWAFVAAIVPGATLGLSTVWKLSDTLNGLMALPNLVALIALSGTVFALTRRYLNQKVQSRTMACPTSGATRLSVARRVSALWGAHSTRKRSSGL